MSCYMAKNLKLINEEMNVTEVKRLDLKSNHLQDKSWVELE